MSTETTTGTAGNSFPVGAASVMELRDDSTGNFKHLVKNAKKRAKEYPRRNRLVVKIRKTAPRS